MTRKKNALAKRATKPIAKARELYDLWVRDGDRFIECIGGPYAKAKAEKLARAIGNTVALRPSGLTPAAQANLAKAVDAVREVHALVRGAYADGTAANETQPINALSQHLVAKLAGPKAEQLADALLLFLRDRLDKPARTPVP